MRIEDELTGARLDWEVFKDAQINVHRETTSSAVHLSATCTVTMFPPIWTLLKELDREERCQTCASNRKVLAKVTINGRSVGQLLAGTRSVHDFAGIVAEGFVPGDEQRWRDMLGLVQEVAQTRNRGQSDGVCDQANELAGQMRDVLASSVNPGELELWARRSYAGKSYRAAPVPASFMSGTVTGGLADIEEDFRQWRSRRPQVLADRADLTEVRAHWDILAQSLDFDSTSVLMFIGNEHDPVVTFGHHAWEPRSERQSVGESHEAAENRVRADAIADMVNLFGVNDKRWFTTTVAVADFLHALAEGVYDTHVSIPIPPDRAASAVDLAQRLTGDGYGASDAARNVAAALS